MTYTVFGGTLNPTQLNLPSWLVPFTTIPCALHLIIFISSNFASCTTFIVQVSQPFVRKFPTQLV